MKIGFRRARFDLSIRAQDGSRYAAWRHVYPGNIRDIAFTVSRDGGQNCSAPVRVSEDGWALDGCPENGPAMAVGANGGIHLVWPTVVSGTAAGSEPALALFDSSSDDGARFTERRRLPTEGTPGHPQIAIGAGDGGVLVVWDEVRGSARSAIAARGIGGYRRRSGPRLDRHESLTWDDCSATDALNLRALTLAELRLDRSAMLDYPDGSILRLSLSI